MLKIDNRGSSRRGLGFESAVPLTPVPLKPTQNTTGNSFEEDTTGNTFDVFPTTGNTFGAHTHSGFESAVPLTPTQNTKVRGEYFPAGTMLPSFKN